MAALKQPPDLIGNSNVDETFRSRLKAMTDAHRQNVLIAKLITEIEDGIYTGTLTLEELEAKWASNLQIINSGATKPYTYELLENDSLES